MLSIICAKVNWTIASAVSASNSWSMVRRLKFSNQANERYTWENKCVNHNVFLAD